MPMSLSSFPNCPHKILLFPHSYVSSLWEALSNIGVLGIWKSKDKLLKIWPISSKSTWEKTLFQKAMNDCSGY